MKYYGIILLAVCIACYALLPAAGTEKQPDPTKLREYLQAAGEAYNKQDFKRYRDQQKKVLALVPNSPRVHYNLACGYALTGDKENALLHAGKAVAMGFALNGIGRDTDFDSMKDMPGFQALLKKAQQLMKPIVNGKQAFLIKEKDLIPEGIAYDSKEKCFYLGSIYKSKIKKIFPGGKAVDFTTSRQDGLGSVLGMNVDAERRLLWVCSEFSPPLPPGVAPEMDGWSGIFKYDLTTGKLIKKYVLHEKNKKHLFNDIALHPDGDVYFTDSLTGNVYTISKKKNKIELFFHSGLFTYPNGIALAPNGKDLYVAGSAAGILVVNLRDKSSFPLEVPAGVTTDGVDGLYCYGGSLVTVRNSFNRITRFFLNKEGNRVESMEILDAHHPHFRNPTTGTIAGDHLYYIANSQIRSFDRKGNIFPMDRLKDVIIMKLPLK